MSLPQRVFHSNHSGEGGLPEDNRSRARTSTLVAWVAAALATLCAWHQADVNSGLRRDTQNERDARLRSEAVKEHVSFELLASSAKLQEMMKQNEMLSESVQRMGQTPPERGLEEIGRQVIADQLMRDYKQLQHQGRGKRKIELPET